ncbi:MAG: YggS family pyridoxal phosphate-dependent enzyme [Bacteroidetes bacterium]|nr:YggS family pyridoxal phosphate-dependent enzyme [Bacteroidota bacterium]
MTISEKTNAIRNRMDIAAQKANRNPNDIKLILATKTVEPEAVREALIFEKNFVAENKVQELSRKAPQLKADKVEFHFIGHLQSNKVKEVLKYADCIQSIDRIGLVDILHKQLSAEGRMLNILMQVNTSYEESKFGISPEEAAALASYISQHETLRLNGLMTIGKFGGTNSETQACFQLLCAVRNELERLNLPNTRLTELSMGMSGDFELAIATGSTMVRIGTAIFGERIYPDSYYWDESK